MYAGGQSVANEHMLLHLLLYNEPDKRGGQSNASHGKAGAGADAGAVNDKKNSVKSGGDVKQGGREASEPCDDLLDKLLTGTLVAFELCLPVALNRASHHAQANSDPSTSESVTPAPLRDIEEMRCVAFRSLCNLSDCDSADALGQYTRPYPNFNLT